MPRDDLQRLRIDDFSPGIRSRAFGTGHSYVPDKQLGVASPNATWRCIALPNGGLGPLPRRDFSLAHGTLPDTLANVANGFFIQGFYVAGHVNAFGATASGRPNELFFGIEWINSSTSRRNWVCKKYNAQVNPGTWITVDDKLNVNILPTLNEYVNTKFVTTRANRTTPTSPGIPVIVYAWYPPGPGGSSYIIGQYPNDTTPTTDAAVDLSTTIPASMLIAHQGRLIYAEQVNYSHGTVGQWLSNENLYWTVVNDTDTLSSATASVFSPENPSGYTAGHTMSANELFLVKADGGALSINGDIDDPTVVNLPSVATAIRSIGAVTPLGFVYPGADGRVYAWAGGDKSQPISPHMEDFFFRPPVQPPFLDVDFIFDMWGNDYLLAPNLYIMDVHNAGWWRLDNPADLPGDWWAAQSLGPRAYYCQSNFTTVDELIVVGWTATNNYHFGEAAQSYSWESQPLWPTVGRIVECREIILTAIGSGTVTVTVTGRGGETDNAAFTLTSTTYPVEMKKSIKCRGSGLVVKIVATTSEPAAPTVFAVDIGIQGDVQVPNG